MKEGRGVITCAKGNKYEGDFKKDKKEGKGVYTWPSGMKYEGEYKNGVKEGKGVFYSTNGNITPLLLADCRPKVNAMANMAGGGGYEVYVGTQLQFLNIQNIHAVRDSHRKMESLCLNATPADVGWSQAIHDAGWLMHLRTILSGALFCSQAMHRNGQNVLVHCSDGWDRTS
jgi:hypothetical protein